MGQKLVRNKASSKAVFPPPTTQTSLPLKKKPSQVAQALTPLPLNLSYKHLDKAGAYAMQDKNDMFIEKVLGSKDNVVGFPSELFKEMIKKL